MGRTRGSFGSSFFLCAKRFGATELLDPRAVMIHLILYGNHAYYGGFRESANGARGSITGSHAASA
jgi:hypothetical protein